MGVIMALMRDRDDKIEGPFLIDENLTFGGLISGGATVRSGVILELSGMITGDLDVELGARATIHGIVNGTFRNHGGYVAIFGSVGAVVDCSPEAQTVVDARALIGSKTGEPLSVFTRSSAGSIWLNPDDLPKRMFRSVGL